MRSLNLKKSGVCRVMATPGLYLQFDHRCEFTVEELINAINRIEIPVKEVSNYVELITDFIALEYDYLFDPSWEHPFTYTVVGDNSLVMFYEDDFKDFDWFHVLPVFYIENKEVNFEVGQIKEDNTYTLDEFFSLVNGLYLPDTGMDNNGEGGEEDG